MAFDAGAISLDFWVPWNKLQTMRACCWEDVRLPQSFWKPPACQGRTNPAFAKAICLCLSDTRHFHHFRLFRGSEERSPCFQWVDCKFVILAVFVKTAPFIYPENKGMVYPKHGLCHPDPGLPRISPNFFRSSLATPPRASLSLSMDLRLGEKPPFPTTPQNPPFPHRALQGNGCSDLFSQGAAKGVRQKEFDHFFVFGTLSVTFRSLFLMLLSLFSSLFCQTPFAGLLLLQGDFQNKSEQIRETSFLPTPFACKSLSKKL